MQATGADARLDDRSTAAAAEPSTFLAAIAVVDGLHEKGAGDRQDSGGEQAAGAKSKASGPEAVFSLSPQVLQVCIVSFLEQVC